MLPIAFGVAWFGYGLASWGYVVHRGWNIGWGEWFNPVHLYDWPADGSDPPVIPPSQVNPSASPKPTAPPSQA